MDKLRREIFEQFLESLDIWARECWLLGTAAKNWAQELLKIIGKIDEVERFEREVQRKNKR